MSEKNRDNKNRWRNVTIAFRMSPEENEELDLRVKLCGYQTRQKSASVIVGSDDCCNMKCAYHSSASFLVLKPLFCDFFLVPVQSVQRYCIRHVPLGSFFALQLMHLPPLLLRTIFP